MIKIHDPSGSLILLDSSRIISVSQITDEDNKCFTSIFYRTTDSYSMTMLVKETIEEVYELIDSILYRKTFRRNV